MTEDEFMLTYGEEGLRHCHIQQKHNAHPWEGNGREKLWCGGERLQKTVELPEHNVGEGLEPRRCGNWAEHPAHDWPETLQSPLFRCEGISAVAAEIDRRLHPGREAGTFIVEYPTPRGHEFEKWFSKKSQEPFPNVSKEAFKVLLAKLLNSFNWDTLLNLSDAEVADKIYEYLVALEEKRSE